MLKVLPEASKEQPFLLTDQLAEQDTKPTQLTSKLIQLRACSLKLFDKTLDRLLHRIIDVGHPLKLYRERNESVIHASLGIRHVTQQGTDLAQRLGNDVQLVRCIALDPDQVSKLVHGQAMQRHDVLHCLFDCIPR